VLSAMRHTVKDASADVQERGVGIMTWTCPRCRVFNKTGGLSCYNCGWSRCSVCGKYERSSGAPNGVCRFSVGDVCGLVKI